MKQKTIFTLILCLIILIGTNLIASKSQINQDEKKGIDGIWQGVLKVSGIELRIVFKINKHENDSLSATLDSPDQGAKDIPVSEVIFENDSLRLGVKVVNGNYKGFLKTDGMTIAGTWSQGGMSLPLDLKRIEKIPELKRPQMPKKPYPYNEEEVEYQNEKAGIKLAGTLTTPKTEAPFPAVILISGSGAQDRDETIFEHRPFLILADYLTRLGIAVLRVDDRGVGGSTGKVSLSTSEDFAGDVLAGVEFLKTRKEIDSKKIGLIGHSEGGIIAPMVANKSDDIAFIVLMAGTGMTGEEILYLQAALIMKTQGVDDVKIAENRDQQEKMFAVMKQEPDSLKAAQKLRDILKKSLAEISNDEKEKMAGADAQINVQIKQVMNPWFRFFLTYDPRSALKKVKCPVLAINGEKDLQVPPKENLAAIEETLKQGGNSNYTIRELPGLNHLFQTAKIGSLSEYGKIEETISPTALKVIGDWILEQITK